MWKNGMWIRCPETDKPDSWCPPEEEMNIIYKNSIKSKEWCFGSSMNHWCKNNKDYPNCVSTEWKAAPGTLLANKGNIGNQWVYTGIHHDSNEGVDYLRFVNPTGEECLTMILNKDYWEIFSTNGKGE
jgi:hypothetical protein